MISTPLPELLEELFFVSRRDTEEAEPAEMLKTLGAKLSAVLALFAALREPSIALRAGGAFV